MGSLTVEDIAEMPATRFLNWLAENGIELHGPLQCIDACWAAQVVDLRGNIVYQACGEAPLAAVHAAINAALEKRNVA